MIPLHTHPNPSRDTDVQSGMDESVTSTTVLTAGRKPPSIQSAARARVYKWSRRIMITTESLWLKKIRRNKFKTFLFVFVPSAFIFVLAFTLAPPKRCSDSNNLMYYMGGLMEPDIMFTAGVTPKRIHSRRDSFDIRYAPLLAALGYGATSIEIYLWLQQDVLYVGAKNPVEQGKFDQTLDEVYLSKLTSMLQSANQGQQKGPPRGVFQTAPRLPLQLVMNIKSDVPPTFQALDQALQPFLDQGWLTTVDTSHPSAPLKLSALTIFVTGDIPLSCFFGSPNSTRYIFFDAPLMQLDGNDVYTPALSPMASASFSDIVGSSWVVPRFAVDKIQDYVEIAHNKGITVRVTQPIDFPMWIRNMYWQILLDSGVDWLDVDDLYSASQF